jgi:hypothetical protein
MDGAWLKFMQDVQKLSSTKVTDKKAYDFFVDTLYPDLEKELTKVQSRKADNLMDLYKGGLGAEFAPNTKWNLLNAITQQFTHGSGKRDSSHQFWDSEYGVYGKIKDKAFTRLLAA